MMVFLLGRIDNEIYSLSMIRIVKVYKAISLIFLNTFFFILLLEGILRVVIYFKYAEKPIDSNINQLVLSGQKIL